MGPVSTYFFSHSIERLQLLLNTIIRQSGILSDQVSHYHRGETETFIGCDAIVPYPTLLYSSLIEFEGCCYLVKDFLHIIEGPYKSFKRIHKQQAIYC
jgi:hypothetical protein